MGRPTVMTPEIIAKLEEAFMNAFTDEEACLYADIGTSTLYNYGEKHPEFLERKEQLKKKPNIKAKLNILKSLNEGDVKDSQWWLERKSKNEFSTKSESVHKGDKDNPLVTRIVRKVVDVNADDKDA